LGLLQLDVQENQSSVISYSPLIAEIKAALKGIQMLIHGSNSLHSRWVPTVVAAAKSNGSE